MSAGFSPREQLLHEIRVVRAQLPSQHQVLLEQIGTQEVAIDEWPSGVQDLYRTLRAAPPAEAELADAAAVYLDELRTIAFNASRLHELISGLTDEWRRTELFDEVVAAVYAMMVERVRTHGYGVPEFLHRDVFEAFQDVIPWPPTR